MLPRQHRLNGAAWRHLPTGGRRLVRPTVQVRHFPATDKRAAVVVSRKVSTKAVVRNRLRRVLYGALENVWLDLPSGYYVVYVQPAAKQMGDVVARGELQDLLGEIIKAR